MKTYDFDVDWSLSLYFLGEQNIHLRWIEGVASLGICLRDAGYAFGIRRLALCYGRKRPYASRSLMGIIPYVVYRFVRQWHLHPRERSFGDCKNPRVKSVPSKAVIRRGVCAPSGVHSKRKPCVCRPGGKARQKK